ncbi:formate dehydrogenase family accessory protein FdhD [Desulfofarcimen acetoxidans DSM 771]|uniref:Sulfur carrier protein FdhD n=1 Tax=Desulfofarcimen acetoxidans (strain ATCC 49208 / DSM 771 / KCTC 5769 / VKM B-1644 / 5575) TaxID=485916 RepID=C8W5V4_DESAS|nr:formate dehydrogenase accessory sulfurtransferase FdhD [Desulfofarcimen acetoxidans]ACV64104.1 formate dehydrogenase family accessory protein FdhD [Desulfofarcimen acetoxidans DSM 771]
MKKITLKLPVTKINNGIAITEKDAVARETPLTIFLNNGEFVTLVCSPQYLCELAVGFLCSEGILRNRQDLTDIKLEENKGIILVETAQPVLEEERFMRRYITSCCGKSRSSFYFINDAATEPVHGSTCVSVQQIRILTDKLENKAQVFRTTGGTHGAALCSATEMLFFYEDIGRHNAVDKLFGKAFFELINLDDKILVLSGRISSEILIKTAKMGIPVIISRAAPTDLAVKMAGELGITVVGFARGNRMNVYTHPDRIHR